MIEIEDEGHDVTVTDHRGYQSYSYDREAALEEDAEARLKKLQSLYNQSLITYEEYEQKKQEVLDEL